MGEVVAERFKSRCIDIYNRADQENFEFWRHSERAGRVGSLPEALALSFTAIALAVAAGAMLCLAQKGSKTFCRVFSGCLGTAAVEAAVESGVIVKWDLDAQKRLEERVALNELRQRFLDLVDGGHSDGPDFAAHIHALQNNDGVDARLFLPHLDVSLDRSTMTALDITSTYQDIYSDQRSWMTPLEYAVRQNDLAAVTQLIEAGAIAKHLLPIALESSSRDEIVQALRAAGAEDPEVVERDVPSYEALKENIRNAYRTAIREERERGTSWWNQDADGAQMFLVGAAAPIGTILVVGAVATHALSHLAGASQGFRNFGYIQAGLGMALTASSFFGWKRLENTYKGRFLEERVAAREADRQKARFAELIRLNEADGEEFSELLDNLVERKALSDEIFEPYLDPKAAVRSPEMEGYKEYVEACARMTHLNAYSHTTFVELAVRSDNVAVVRQLVEAGAPVGPSHGRNLVMVALQEGAGVEVIEALIDAGAEVPETDARGNNVVEWARANDTADEVIELLDPEAD